MIPSGRRSNNAVQTVGLVLVLLLAPLLAGCLGSRGEGVADDGGDDARDALGTVRVVSPDSVHVGERVHFAAERTRPDVQAFHFWDFGDGTTASGIGLHEVAHAYAEAGAYTVALTLVNGQGDRVHANATVGVRQEFTFEGTVARGPARELGSPSFTADFPVRDALASIECRLELARAEPVPLPVDATGARVTVRVHAPGASVPAFERAFDVEGGGARVFSVPGDRFPREGNATLEIVADSGVVSFRLGLETTYLSA